jgi:hypothetical protein
MMVQLRVTPSFVCCSEDRGGRRNMGRGDLRGGHAEPSLLALPTVDRLADRP